MASRLNNLTPPFGPEEFLLSMAENCQLGAKAINFKEGRTKSSLERCTQAGKGIKNSLQR